MKSFNLMWRVRGDKIWQEFGFRYARADDCDIKTLRRKYPGYKFTLAYY